MKRVAVTVAGGLLTLAGVATLVLPGPGMVLCAAGLGLLATQYTWARRSVGWARAQARDGVERTGSSRWLTAGSLASGAFLLVIGIAEIIHDLPVVNTVSALLMLASGLFLLVTSIAARHRHLRRERFPHHPVA